MIRPTQNRSQEEDRGFWLECAAVCWPELLARFDSMAREAPDSANGREVFFSSFRKGTSSSPRWLGVIGTMLEEGALTDDEAFFGATVLILELAGGLTPGDLAAVSQVADALRRHGEGGMAELCERDREEFLRRCQRGRETLSRR